jgi:hypothetical protein
LNKTQEVAMYLTPSIKGMPCRQKPTGLCRKFYDLANDQYKKLLDMPIRQACDLFILHWGTVPRDTDHTHYQRLAATMANKMLAEQNAVTA